MATVSGVEKTGGAVRFAQVAGVILLSGARVRGNSMNPLSQPSDYGFWAGDEPSDEFDTQVDAFPALLRKHCALMGVTSLQPHVQIVGRGDSLAVIDVRIGSVFERFVLHDASWEDTPEDAIVHWLSANHAELGASRVYGLLFDPTDRPIVEEEGACRRVWLASLSELETARLQGFASYRIAGTSTYHYTESCKP